MSAINWTERARAFLKTPPPHTDETDERGVSSVLSVRPPTVSEKTGVTGGLASDDALLPAEASDLAPLLADPDVAAARAAMHRLGYCDAEAESQLQAVLQSVPAATVAADLQAIGDERGLPPTKVAEPERYVAPLIRRRSERHP